MSTRYCQLLLLLGILGNSVGEVRGEPLGRLFFTPQQRLALDRQRQGESPTQSAEPDASLTLDGEIRPRNGRRIYWINGKMAESAKERLPSLAVGDTFQRHTGERASLLGEGRIIIRAGASK